MSVQEKAFALLEHSQTRDQPPAQPIPDTSPPPVSVDSQAPLLSLQEQLWNQAYDELKTREAEVVNAYETILSVRLKSANLEMADSESTKNEIGKSRSTRCQQMQQLVHDGLDRKRKDASVKEGICEDLQAVRAVRAIAKQATEAAPQSAVAWIGVCIELEILSNSFTEDRIDYKGIAYVLSRMNWYWNLVHLLLDKNKAIRSSTELRDEMENHIVQLYQKLLLYQMKTACVYYWNKLTAIGTGLVPFCDWDGQVGDIKNTEAVVQRDAEQYNSEQVKIHLGSLATAALSQEKEFEIWLFKLSGTKVCNYYGRSHMC
ncbi:nacht and wd domain-containing protein [Metarhizium brunneum]